MLCLSINVYRCLRQFSYHIILWWCHFSVTQAVSHVDQELLTISVHMSSPPVLVGFVLFYCPMFVFSSFFLSACCLIVQLSVYCFIVHCLSFRSFSFGHCIVYPSVFAFWLLLLYLLAFFKIKNVDGITRAHCKLQYKNRGGF